MYTDLLCVNSFIHSTHAVHTGGESEEEDDQGVSMHAFWCEWVRTYAVLAHIFVYTEACCVCTGGEGEEEDQHDQDVPVQTLTLMLCRIACARTLTHMNTHAVCTQVERARRRTRRTRTYL